MAPGRKTIRYTGVERRRFSRLKGPLSVRFCLVFHQESEPRSGVIVGKTRDVSAEGLCLETNRVIIDRTHIVSEAMGDGKSLSLSIEIPDETEPLETLGKVVWYDLAPEDSDFRFRAGVLFTEMREDEGKRWKQFLSAIQKKWTF